MGAKSATAFGRGLRRALALILLGLLVGAALPLLLPVLPETAAEPTARLAAWVPGLEEVRAEPLALHARWGAPALSLDDGLLETGPALAAVLAAWGALLGGIAAVLWLASSLRVPLAVGGLVGALLGFGLASCFALEGGDWVRAAQGSLLRGLEGLPGIDELRVPAPAPVEVSAAEPPEVAASVEAEPEPEVEPEVEPEPGPPGWRLASRRGTVAEAATDPPWTGGQPPPKLTARGAAWFVLYGALAAIAAAFVIDAAGHRKWRQRLPRATIGLAVLGWVLTAFLPAGPVRRLEALSARLPVATPAPAVEPATGSPEEPTVSPPRALELAGLRVMVFRADGAASVTPALLAVLLLVVAAALLPLVLLDAGWGVVRAGRKGVRRWRAERGERKRLRRLDQEAPSDEEREERKRERMREDLKDWLGGDEQPPPED